MDGLAWRTPLLGASPLVRARTQLPGGASIASPQASRRVPAVRPDRLGEDHLCQAAEAGGAVRLSVDEQVHARHGRYGVDDRMEEYFDRERPVVQKLRRRLVELVESGRAEVLDYGRWRRSDRDADTRLVEAHGGSWRLLCLKVDREVLLQRLVERNRRGDANALMVTPSALEDFVARFDEPVGEGEELVEAQPPG